MLRQFIRKIFSEDFFTEYQFIWRIDLLVFPILLNKADNFAKKSIIIFKKSFGLKNIKTSVFMILLSVKFLQILPSEAVFIIIIRR